MNYIAFKKVLESTFNKPDLIKVSIRIQPMNFFNHFNSISKLHRSITNSKQNISGKSNRDFWKQYFQGGLYTFKISNEAIFIDYYLAPNDKLNNGTLNNLKTRIKKVIWSEIEITFSSIDSKLIDELEKQHTKGVRFIGNGYKIKTTLSTTT